VDVAVIDPDVGLRYWASAPHGRVQCQLDVSTASPSPLWAGLPFR
jgi:hypothetical protein